MNGWQIGAVIVLVIVLSFFAGRCSGGGETPSGRDTVETVRLDTIRLETVVYRNLPARHDTIYLKPDTAQTWGDDNRVLGIIHSVDTVFVEHNDSLRVEYLEPDGLFNLSFKPGPRLIEVRDSIVYVPRAYSVETISLPWIVGSVAVGMALGIAFSK